MGLGVVSPNRGFAQVGDAGVATVIRAEGIGGQVCFLYLQRVRLALNSIPVVHRRVFLFELV